MLNQISTRHHRYAAWLLGLVAVMMPASAMGQFGGGGAGGGAQAPAGPTKVKFRDHIHAREGMTTRRERGDALVRSVRVIGNDKVTLAKIDAELQTRKDRFYDYETVLGDVRRLNDMGLFDRVTFKLTKHPVDDPEASVPISGPGEVLQGESVSVAFIVHERAIVSKVIYHGNRAMNDRELKNRSGVSKGDPMSEFSIESGRRRLVDYYREEGFNQVSVEAVMGLPDDPSVVVFRINEGPKERIAAIAIEGSTIVNEARLKKIILSRGPLGGVLTYIGNKADLNKINEDVDVLAGYYHDLGFLTATVGRRIEYDESGKWMTVTFVVYEGPRFQIGDIQIVGNQYYTTESLQRRMTLKNGDMFDGTVMRQDIGELVYGYGEQGFIYAEVQPKTIMRDESGTADIVYEIIEGDRWKIGKISVNIDGEPHLMRETTMLNMVDMREGDLIDRRKLEIARRSIERSQLLETNPAVAETPDIKVVPRDEVRR